MKSPWSVQWLTWVMHFTLAAVATFVVGQFEESGIRAASYPIAFYVAREGEQLSKKVWKKFFGGRTDISFGWFDHGIDAATAVAGALLVALVLL